MNIDLEIFKVLYLMVHSDFDFSKEEKEILEDFQSKLTGEEQAELKPVLGELDGVIGEGFDSIIRQTETTAAQLSPELTPEMKQSYLKIIDIMIMADGKEHPNEVNLKERISTIWNFGA